MPVITIKGVPKSKHNDLKELIVDLQNAVASEPAIGKGPGSVNVYFLEDFAKSDHDICVEILLITREERTSEVLKNVEKNIKAVLDPWREHYLPECSKIVIYFHCIPEEHLFINHYQSKDPLES